MAGRGGARWGGWGHRGPARWPSARAVVGQVCDGATLRRWECPGAKKPLREAQSWGSVSPRHHRHPPRASLAAPRLPRRRLLQPSLGTTWETRVTRVLAPVPRPRWTGGGLRSAVLGACGWGEGKRGGLSKAMSQFPVREGGLGWTLGGVGAERHRPATGGWGAKGKSEGLLRRQVWAGGVLPW